MRRLAWLSLLAWAIGQSSHAKATPEAFAHRIGYIAGNPPSTIQPGAVLWVDSLGPEPRLLDILCTGTEVIGRTSLEESQLAGAQYSAQVGDPPVNLLSVILQDINNETSATMMLGLTLSVTDAHARTLPDSIIASPLSRATVACRRRLAELRGRSDLPVGGFTVMVTSELIASLQCRATWAPGPTHVVNKLILMHDLAAWLPIHGGLISSAFANGAPQRLGWQHDQGSLAGEFLAASGRHWGASLR